MNWRRRQFTGLLLTGGAVAALPRLAQAHPYHATLTEARHNREQGTLECSMRVDPHALQAALRRAGDRKLKVDSIDGASLDRLCDAYLRTHFEMSAPKSAARPLAFVGHELGDDFAWLHFQVAVGSGESLSGFRLENRVFFEIAPAQVNRVQIRHGGRTQTLLFRIEHPSEIISAQER